MVEDICNYIKPILKWKLKKEGDKYQMFFCMWEHVETHNANRLTPRKILGKLLQLKTAVLDSNESCKFILVQPMAQVDDGKAC